MHATDSYDATYVLWWVHGDICVMQYGWPCKPASIVRFSPGMHFGGRNIDAMKFQFNVVIPLIISINRLSAVCLHFTWSYYTVDVCSTADQQSATTHSELSEKCLQIPAQTQISKMQECILIRAKSIRRSVYWYQRGQLASEWRYLTSLRRHGVFMWLLGISLYCVHMQSVGLCYCFTSTVNI